CGDVVSQRGSHQAVETQDEGPDRAGDVQRQGLDLRRRHAQAKGLVVLDVQDAGIDEGRAAVEVGALEDQGAEPDLVQVGDGDGQWFGGILDGPGDGQFGNRRDADGSVALQGDVARPPVQAGAVAQGALAAVPHGVYGDGGGAECGGSKLVQVRIGQRAAEA